MHGFTVDVAQLRVQQAAAQNHKLPTAAVGLDATQLWRRKGGGTNKGGKNKGGKGKNKGGKRAW